MNCVVTCGGCGGCGGGICCCIKLMCTCESFTHDCCIADIVWVNR